MEEEKKEKKVLICIDDRVRVIEYDTRNLEVQTLKEIKRKTGEVEMDWVFRGYCGNMVEALTHIVNKDLLMDYTTIAKVEDYLDHCEQVKKSILKAIKSLG